MTHDSELIRVHNEFIEEIKNVRQTREDKKFTKISWPQLTKLLTKHSSWKVIKRDLENYEYD